MNERPENAGLDASLEADMWKHMYAYFASHDGQLPPEGLYERLLPHFERPLLCCALKACGGNQIKAAGLLGINRNTLRKKLRTHQIDAKSFTGDTA